MSATSTAQVETLHPRPARQSAAAPPPRKHKAKRAPASVAPLHGWENLDSIMRRGLADTRAALGLANGLHELFALRLAEAEEELSRLGARSSDDGPDQYISHKSRTQDLRTWVGVLAALKERAESAESDAREVAERVGYAVRRGGAQ